MYSALRFFCRAVGYSKTHSAISDCANRCVNFKHRFSGYRRQLVLCYAETLSLESPFPKNSEIKCQCSCSSTFDSDWANRSIYFTLRFFCRVFQSSFGRLRTCKSVRKFYAPLFWTLAAIVRSELRKFQQVRIRKCHCCTR